MGGAGGGGKWIAQLLCHAVGVLILRMNHSGALRQHLHATLKRQLSQKRAEERKLVEEERKLYGEEDPGNVEGEEAELTDQDTTGLVWLEVLDLQFIGL